MTKDEKILIPDISDPDRRVGIEIEFTKLELASVGDIVIKHVGGQAQKNDAYVLMIKNTKLGDFKIECDSSFLKDRAYQRWFEQLGLELEDQTKEAIDSSLATHSQILIPREIVTPPVPLKYFSEINTIVEDMKKAFIENEGQPLSLAPCGLHLNIEVESLDVDYLLSILQSFFLLYDKLLSGIGVAVIRRLAPYIRPFPKEYGERILDTEYNPSINQLIRDYFYFNPTRNRALDMSVIFAHINPNLLKEVEGLETNLIKPRPAFHYRLPNADLGDVNWSLANELERWLKVEQFAKELRSSKTTNLSSYEEMLNNPCEAL